MGGKLHLKLNIGERPIANKYREGKMQRTLKRESKGLEIVNREAIVSSIHTRDTQAVALLGWHWCARRPHGRRRCLVSSASQRGWLHLARGVSQCEFGGAGEGQ